MATTIANKIQDLVGSDMSVSIVTSYEDIIRDSFNYIADLIPADSEIWYANNTLERATLNDGYDIHGKKILLITSKSTGVADTREVREVSWPEYLKAIDNKSIFFAGGTRNPVYSISPSTAGIKVANRVGTSTYYIYFYAYITQDISAYTTFENLNSGTAGKGFPDAMIALACIKSSISLLNSRISEAVQDDEDAELLQILQGQLQILQQSYQEELQRFALPYKELGVTNETA